MLTEAEKQLLVDQKNSEFHRVFLKAIEAYKAQVLSELLSVESEKELFRAQGRLLGLQMCSNIVQVFGTHQKVDTKKPVRSV